MTLTGKLIRLGLALYCIGELVYGGGESLRTSQCQPLKETNNKIEIQPNPLEDSLNVRYTFEKTIKLETKIE